MKKSYDVWLMKQVESSIDGDFEMIDSMVAENYRDATRKAKDQSMLWDACNVVCEVWDDEGDYDILWKERYVRGKKIYRTLS